MWYFKCNRLKISAQVLSGILSTAVKNSKLELAFIKVQKLEKKAKVGFPICTVLGLMKRVKHTNTELFSSGNVLRGDSDASPFVHQVRVVHSRKSDRNITFFRLTPIVLNLCLKH